MGYPFSVDYRGYGEVIKGHFFKLKKPLQRDVEFPFPLLAGVWPQEFPEPRLEALQAEQTLSHLVDSPVFPRKRCYHSPLQMELMAERWMQAR